MMPAVLAELEHLYLYRNNKWFKKKKN
jgi:hypothetical protein